MDSESRFNADKKQRCDQLHKELRYILTFLGDKPFLSSELEEIQNILSKFEILANDAGSFIYSFVFPPNAKPIQASSFNACKDALLEKFSSLNSEIKEYCVKFKLSPPTRTLVLGSNFIVDSLKEDLENLMNRQCFVSAVKDIKDQIKTLHEELIWSQTLIKDIKVQQSTNKDELEESIIAIRDSAYEAEYLINSHVLENVPVWYLKLRLFDIVKKIKCSKKILEDEIICQHSVLRVTEDLGEVSPQYVGTPKLLIDDFVMGFEESRIKIWDDLNGGSKNLQFISILGMPGLGKTTFANHLYNDRDVCDHFDRRSWCVISETYDKRKALIDILVHLATTPEKDNLLKLDTASLALNIYQSLKGLRYLIILDDVWHLSIWDDLRRCLPNDGNGSRIIFTSRVKDTAPTGTIFHEPPLLSEVQCWNLLLKKVFRNARCPSELVSIGKKIAKQCCGLPLAVVTTAGILADRKKEKNVWTNIEKDFDSYISAGSSDYMKVLELSYKHLPGHLKPCFLYLGVFSKGEEIAVRKLTWLWIAEGFIEKEEMKSIEQVAEEYIFELINRSLLVIAKHTSGDGIKACRIHDLLHDMCLRKGHQENFLKAKKEHFSIYEKHSHLHVQPTIADHWRPLGLHCRSLHSYPVTHQAPCFKRMPLLRVVELQIGSSSNNVCATFDDPDIPINLRYLGINQVPLQLRNFTNLEFLCIQLQSADWNPEIDFIQLMRKLSNLDIKPMVKLGECFSSHETNLKYLSYARINTQKGTHVLKSSPHLRTVKCDCDETIFPDFGYLSELVTLRMDFRSHFKGEISKINFPFSVKKLCLSGIGLTWEEMSLVGRLPNLQVLKLERRSFIGEEWETRDGEFQELRFLKLSMIGIKLWSTWSDHFPKLRCLAVHFCRSLQEIPSEIGHIPTLQKIEVSYCEKEVNLSAARIEKEQKEYGNEELNVVVQNPLM